MNKCGCTGYIKMGRHKIKKKSFNLRQCEQIESTNNEKVPKHVVITRSKE